LAFADFHKVAASLDEGINLSEDLLVFLKVPVVSSGRVELDHFHLVLRDLFPLLAAMDGLSQVSNTFFNVVAEHVFLVDLSLASLNDLVRNAREE
jgi:hypothetical protein